MVIYNFSHPLLDEVVKKVEKKVGEKVSCVNIKVQVDDDHSITSQMVDIMDGINFDGNPIIVNLPGLSVAAAEVVRYLDERGIPYQILRLRRVGTPPKFIFSELF